MGKSYRPCVVAVFVNEKKNVLVGQRTNLPGAWQFPQGGVDAAEDEATALRREVFEELGVNDFEILAKSTTVFRYDFPNDFNIAISKKYAGQDQRWFLCKLYNHCPPNLDQASDQEFDDLKWVSPSIAYENIVEWKKKVYFDALADLGFIIE